MCADHLGRTPKEVIDERLMLEIKRKLITTGMPIKAIAAALGFTDHSALARYFRRHASTSPAAWRRVAAQAWSSGSNTQEP